MIGSRTTKPAVTRPSHLRDSTFQSEVRIQVQVYDGRWSVICEVESMYLNHNVHLVCPLMQPRCFENCKRICEPSGCVHEPSLTNVSCTTRQTEPTATGGFVRRFEYQIDQYDQNITGSWSCFFAGTESEKIHLVAEPPTTTATTTKTTTASTTATTARRATSKRTISTATSAVSPAGITLESDLVVGPRVSNFSRPNLDQSVDRKTGRTYSAIAENTMDRPLGSPIRNALPYFDSGFTGKNDTYPLDTFRRSNDGSSSGRAYSFLNFISANLHVVLGFMALLALSLLTNLVFCLQFLRMTRKRAKHEVSQSPFSSASLALHGMNNSASGSLKVVRTHEAGSGVCRPVSWISPIANNSRTVNQRQSSGCSVTNSKSCHFASLSVQLGSDNTLINPVTSHQFIPSAPLHYWAASPITTSLYPSVTDACAKPMERNATLDFSCNRWTNQAPALRSSCSFSSNGCSVDDSFDAMHRSVTLPFAPEANRSYMPMPVYMTTSASRTPSQTSVGVRLLPSYALPRWLTSPHRCSSKVRLIPKSKKETAEDIQFEKHRLSNVMNGPHKSETLVIEKNTLAKKLHPLCGDLHKPTPSQLLTGTVTAASVEKETDVSEITGNRYNIGRINEQNRFMQRENGKSSNFHHISTVPQVAGL
ncbi:hypothetical protein D915_002840 [Fasciola hepatica]|uniref:Uncharacterized protein n=1 Tax=Fasciola hepatica TaxID=6192 RepID=A0A4E0RFU2_FASHE|nr:hypothetical protein D915_002840 [Fasciola hepatica]